MYYRVGAEMENNTQMLKGLLEGCILKIVSSNETYGYEICEKLTTYGFDDISEGSVYPILVRLEKREAIYSSLKKSPYGPMRKYYYLSENGMHELNIFIQAWNKIKINIDNVLGE